MPAPVDTWNFGPEDRLLDKVSLGLVRVCIDTHVLDLPRQTFYLDARPNFYFLLQIWWT